MQYREEQGCESCRWTDGWSHDERSGIAWTVPSKLRTGKGVGIVRGWLIEGGSALHGAVRIGGSKYSALAAIPACLLADGPSVLHNVPDILDVRAYLALLESFGATVQRSDRSVRIDPGGACWHPVPTEWSTSLRASTYMLAVQLVRWGQAWVGLPGGDRLGKRPLDLHLKVLRAVGAEVEMTAQATEGGARRLHGAHVYLDVPSVGATVQAMLAGVRAEGETRLENAYIAPFIVDLANLLNEMGADVRGAGTSTVRIYGRPVLVGTEHSLIADQAEAFTYLAAAAATRGRVRVHGGVEASHLTSGLRKLEESGAVWRSGDGWVEVEVPQGLGAIDVQTGPLPAFYTDYQPPLAAVLATASGVSRIVENVWPERFGYASALEALGAPSRVRDNELTVVGARQLHGAEVEASESRSAAACAIACLAAEGRSTVRGVEPLDRVCEAFVPKLLSLGARIQETQTADMDASTLLPERIASH